MKVLKSLLILMALFTPWLTTVAQEFSPTQGYRLEIADDMALECTGGVITFNPVNKKAGSQVWNIQPSSRKGYYTLVSPMTLMAVDNGNHGSQPGEACPWDLNPDNSNQHWKIEQVSEGIYTITSGAGGLRLG